MSKDVILALGAPPKLGAKQAGLGRAQTSKAYKGSMLPDMDDEESEDADAQDDPRDREPDDMLVGAAQDVMASLHSGNRDPARVAEALQSFVQMCM